jgi:hypothetical protein
VAIGMLNMASPMAKDNITLRNTINNKIEEYSRQKTR